MYYSGLGDYGNSEPVYYFSVDSWGVPINDSSLTNSSSLASQYEVPLTQSSTVSGSGNSGSVNGKQVLVLVLIASILIVAARK